MNTITELRPRCRVAHMQKSQPCPPPPVQCPCSLAWLGPHPPALPPPPESEARSKTSDPYNSNINHWVCPFLTKSSRNSVQYYIHSERPYFLKHTVNTMLCGQLFQTNIPDYAFNYNYGPSTEHTHFPTCRPLKYMTSSSKKVHAQRLVWLFSTTSKWIFSVEISRHEKPKQTRMHFPPNKTTTKLSPSSQFFQRGFSGDPWADHTQLQISKIRKTEFLATQTMWEPFIRRWISYRWMILQECRKWSPRAISNAIRWPRRRQHISGRHRLLSKSPAFSKGKHKSDYICMHTCAPAPALTTKSDIPKRNRIGQFSHILQI